MLLYSIRILWKNKLFSSINVIGLTFGLTAAIWLMLFLKNELTYDQHFQDHERIFRVSHILKAPGVEFNTAYSVSELPEKMQDEIPGIESFVRFGFINEPNIVYQNNNYQQDQMYYTDPSLFDVFDLTLIAGNEQSALNSPGAVIISRSVKERLFGNDSGLNQVIEIDGEERQVTAVFEDLPKNTHFKFDVLISGVGIREFAIQDGVFNSEAFWNPDCMNFIKLEKGATKENVISNFEPLNEKYYMPFGNQIGGSHQLRLENILEIHYNSESIDDDFARGNRTNLYVFTAVGIAILLLACINYINLSTARAGLRAKEIGIRKVLGTHINGLRASLLMESIVQVVFAFLLSSLTTWLLINYSPLQQWLGVNFEFTLFQNPSLLLVTFGVVLLTGIISGLYPAIYLSQIKTVSALKGNWSAGKSGKMLRQGLVLFQFVISVAVLLSTLLMKDQIKFLQNKDLGFAKDQVILISTPDSVAQSRYLSLKNELETFPAIQSVTSSPFIVGKGFGQMVFKAEVGGEKKQVEFKFLNGDADYLETFGIELAEGKGYSKEGTRQNAGFIINETAAKVIGWDNPVGERIGFFHQDDLGEVIGVMKDFNHISLHNPIEPLILVYNPNPGRNLIIRFTQDQDGQAVEALQAAWDEQLPNYSLEYSYLNARLKEQYDADVSQNKLVGSMTLLCVIISLIGLTGLTAFNIDQRRKEIGIRKVLGALPKQIVQMIFSGTFRLLILASIIATPLAYWAISQWSQNFEYRTSINILLIFAGLATAILLTFVLVGSLVLRSTQKNPVESLRHE